MENSSTGLQKSDNNLSTVTDSLFIAVDMSGSELPDLDDAEIMPIELMSTYWTPEASGECKKVFFDSIKPRLMPSTREGEEAVLLACAYFIEKTNHDYVSICNGSKRLVAAIENGLVHRGVPLIITYLGKIKNSTNAFKSDSWSVKPLIPKQFSLSGSKVKQDIEEAVKANANKTTMSFDDDLDNASSSADEQNPI